jgi:hypothetical protein
LIRKAIVCVRLAIDTELRSTEIHIDPHRSTRVTD